MLQLTFVSFWFSLVLFLFRFDFVLFCLGRFSFISVDHVSFQFVSHFTGTPSITVATTCYINFCIDRSSFRNFIDNRDNSRVKKLFPLKLQLAPSTVYNFNLLIFNENKSQTQTLKLMGYR